MAARSASSFSSASSIAGLDVISAFFQHVRKLDDSPVKRVQAVSRRFILNRRPLLMPPTPKGPAAADGLLIPCLGSVERRECEVATGVP